MILSFKKQFVPKIESGQKIHTIRLDPHHRWQKGKKIHFATGVRTPNYNCFREGECKFIQAIHIDPFQRIVWVGLNGRMHEISKQQIGVLAEKDGFESVEDFWTWFNRPFVGVIVHWTDFVYN